MALAPDPEAGHDHQARLRAAWNRAGHPGWLMNTQGQPGNQRLRVYLACILRGVDWGNPNWPEAEEQRLFYEPSQGEETETTPDDYQENPLPWWHDGLAGGVTGLALALGAAISLGWIHL